MTKKDIQMRQDIGTPAGRAGGSKKWKKNVNPEEKHDTGHLTDIEA